jgi:plasmid replication initiation protein
MTISKHNLVATISNKLITARYNLTKPEKLLVLLFISKIDNNICKIEGKERDSLEIISPNTIYTVTTEDYAREFNLDYEYCKDILAKAIDDLFEQEITYIDVNEFGENRIVTTRWISSKIKYDNVEHKVSLKWAVDIIPFISELRKDFTSLKLRFLATLGTNYSDRFYEIFIMALDKSYRREIELFISIEEIKYMFELENSYPRVSDLLKRVVDDSVNRINRDVNCNINVSLRDEGGKKMYRKEGKRVVEVGFIVGWR